jgi:hypothetical protein
MPKRNQCYAARRPSGLYVCILDDAIRHRINDMIDTSKIFGCRRPGAASAFAELADWVDNHLYL